MGNLLVIGATSSIARALCFEFAKEKHALILAARDEAELQTLSKDIQIRFETAVTSFAFDIENLATHALFMEKIMKESNGIDGIIIAAGTMEPPAQKILNTNLNGVVSLLEICASYFENTDKSSNPRKKSFIAVISSVAGDRGRQSNYIYGAAKGGLNIYCQGLQNRLHKNNVRVITLKLGFVDTAMTFGLKGLFLVAAPEKIAQKFMKKYHQKFNMTDSIYLPWFWRAIMLIIKSIPECLFKRMSL